MPPGGAKLPVVPSSGNDVAAAPRPGWYTDPAGGGYRWWDGSAWTTQVVKPPENATVAPAGPRPRPTPRPTDAGGAAGTTPRRVAPPAPGRVAATPPPPWVAPVTAALVALGAVLVVVGSVMPWLRANAPGATSVTRLGTDSLAGWLTIGLGVLAALEAGRWLQRRHASRAGAVLVLLAAVACAAAGVAGFAHLAGGAARLPGATGPVTRTAGIGLPLLAAGCVAVLSGSLAGALG